MTFQEIGVAIRYPPCGDQSYLSLRSLHRRQKGARLLVDTAPELRVQLLACGIGRVDAINVRKRVILPPGVTMVALDAKEFPQLHLRDPKLWWPNGYGPANLYALQLSVTDQGALTDSKTLRFGVRQMTYE